MLPATNAIRRWPRSRRWSTACAHPAGVVRLDRARAELGRDVAIEKDDRHLELGELLERRGIGLGRERQDQAIDPPAEQEPDMGDIERRLALRPHEHQRIAVRPKDRLDPESDAGEQRVRDVGDDETNRPRLAATQALGKEVRLVLEPGDRLEDPCAHLVAHVRVLGQHARHRRDRHIRQFGDLPHAHAAPAIHAPSRPNIRPRTVIPRTLSHASSGSATSGNLHASGLTWGVCGCHHARTLTPAANEAGNVLARVFGGFASRPSTP